MLLCEVEEYMETLRDALPDQSVRYKESAEIAILCIEAQMRLRDALNDLCQFENNVFCLRIRLEKFLKSAGMIGMSTMIAAMNGRKEIEKWSYREKRWRYVD